jgi:hypothetical protein
MGSEQWAVNSEQRAVGFNALWLSAADFNRVDSKFKMGVFKVSYKVDIWTRICGCADISRPAPINPRLPVSASIAFLTDFECTLLFVGWLK